jgi:hypothetical protein
MFPVLVPMLLNSIKSMIMDKAQSLAEEHVEKAIEDNLPPEAKELLEKAISDDPAHSATDLKSFLKL